jgi:localization factor PodJL
MDPSVREQAEAAARRAGMSLSEWLQSNVGDYPAGARAQDSHAQTQGATDVSDLHQRLDSLTRQIDQISRPASASGAASRTDSQSGEPAVARQLNDAISRLDARLAKISEPASARQASADPASLDFAIAEITARQNELQSGSRASTGRGAPIAAGGPDISELERHFSKINSRLDELQRPDTIEQSIAAFRGELAEIRVAITEAMPRRAIESIENEIRSLAQRIDDTRQNGMDSQALTGVERALGEVREALRGLTSAEQLAGFDDTVRNLGSKIDLIVRANGDPGAIGQLEGAISALRSIVSNVASNEALARLSDEVHALSSKVDQFAFSEGHGDSFAALEQRIAALTSTLETHERPAVSPGSEQLEGALRALSDRLDHLPAGGAGGDNLSAFAHLEQRVSYLLERLEISTEPRASHFERIEENLQAVLHRLDMQHAGFVATPGSGRAESVPNENGVVDVIKRELSDLRLGQTETGRYTQDALEIVHNTLGHVVDRLAVIEGDLRARTAPASQTMPHAEPQHYAAPRESMPQARPELPNPAAADLHFAAAPREFHAASSAATMAPRAISEILDSHAAQHQRAAIDPELPPDHPLEPGTRPVARIVPPSERIAAPNEAAGEADDSEAQPSSTTSFIAAARRAAKASAALPAKDKSAKAAKPAAGPLANGKEPSTITSKIRSLLVGASVVVIVLGTFKMAMTLLDSSTAPPPAMENSSEAPPSVVPPADGGAAPANSAPVTPSMTSPTPIGRQSLSLPELNAPSRSATTRIPQVASTVQAVPFSDITGSIAAAHDAVSIPATSAAVRKITQVQVPATERLPDAIGGMVLRSAALRGDPSAAYEIGVRFSEGKGVPVNLDEAAKWFDRAAQAGVVPAIFRLGTFYEKGLSVKKDTEIARRYYLQAAERGNAKAMHNLAVLDADGGGKGADYKSASQWFRKAADCGVSDSQFNLGILYARGIGVEQNLAESFKWFSLAAGQGDTDSGRKRDDIARRLDAQSLAAATLAIQTFVPETQPDDAVNAAAPPGGWDAAQGQMAASKSANSKAGTLKRAIH